MFVNIDVPWIGDVTSATRSSLDAIVLVESPLRSIYSISTVVLQLTREIQGLSKSVNGSGLILGALSVSIITLGHRYLQQGRY